MPLLETQPKALCTCARHMHNRLGLCRLRQVNVGVQHLPWGMRNNLTDKRYDSEHMRRVHTRTHGCQSCGHRFTNVNKNNMLGAKTAHQCKPEDIRKFKLDSRCAPEWLSEKQEEKYNALTFPRGNSSESPKAVFEKIYRALWPEDSAVPSHCELARTSQSLMTAN